MEVKKQAKNQDSGFRLESRPRMVYITYDPKPKTENSLPLESEILPCELDVPFQGTPQVHLGIPHMNFGGPLFAQNTSK